MPRYRRPPSQGWRTFLRNHADAIASVDLLVVPTINFALLYVLIVLGQTLKHIDLRVQVENPTGAVRLYKKLGVRKEALDRS